MPSEEDRAYNDRDDRDDRPARRRDDGDKPFYEEPHRGTMILIMGILGLVMCPIVGIAAWIMGKNDMRAINEGRMDPEGKQLTQVGMILGIVATCLLALQMVILVIYLVIFGIVIANAPKPVPVNNPAPVFKQVK